MITLTTEQAQLIEDALKYARNVCVGSNWSTYDADVALSVICAARAQEQAEQEPVGEVKILRMNTDDSKFHYVECQHLPEGTKLYTRPVRTKDLTDEELWEAAKTAKSNDLTDAFRAVIAADREKNK